MGNGGKGKKNNTGAFNKCCYGSQDTEDLQNRKEKMRARCKKPEEKQRDRISQKRIKKKRKKLIFFQTNNKKSQISGQYKFMFIKMLYA